MLKASVKMGFFLQAHYLLKVRMIDVCIHTEQSLENSSNNVLKISRKRGTCAAKKYETTVALYLFCWKNNRENTQTCLYSIERKLAYPIFEGI